MHTSKVGCILVGEIEWLRMTTGAFALYALRLVKLTTKCVVLSTFKLTSNLSKFSFHQKTRKIDRIASNLNEKSDEEKQEKRDKVKVNKKNGRP